LQPKHAKQITHPQPPSGGPGRSIFSIDATRAPATGWLAPSPEPQKNPLSALSDGG